MHTPTMASQNLSRQKHPSRRLWWRLSLLLPFLLMVIWRPTMELHPDLQFLLNTKCDKLQDSIDRIFSGFRDDSRRLKSPWFRSLSAWMQKRGLDDSWLWEESKPPDFFEIVAELMRKHGQRIVISIPSALDKLLLDDEGVDLRDFMQGQAVLVTAERQTFVVVVLHGVFKLHPDLTCLLLFDANARPRDTFVGVYSILDFRMGDSLTKSQLFIFYDEDERPLHKIVIRHGRFVDLLKHSE